MITQPSGEDRPCAAFLPVRRTDALVSIGQRTAKHNVAAANKLAVEVDLGDSGPVRVLLDSSAELTVIETVVSGDLVRVHVLHLQNLDDSTAEAALGHVWGTLHEDNKWVLLHGAVNLGADVIREETHEAGRDRRCRKTRCTERGALVSALRTSNDEAVRRAYMVCGKACVHVSSSQILHGKKCTSLVARQG